MEALPPDVEAARLGLKVVEYDGAWEAVRPGPLHQFTIRDPEFPDLRPSFYLAHDKLTPAALILAYYAEVKKFAEEFEPHVSRLATA